MLLPLVPKQTDLIKQLTGSPMEIPESLSKFILSNPQLREKIFAIEPRNLREEDKGVIEDLDKLVKSLTQGKYAQYYGQWVPVQQKLLEFCDFGLTGRVETIAAMILAGAVINREDIKINELRSGLDTSLLAEAQKTRNIPITKSDNKFAKSYDALRISDPKRTLSQKIHKLLTDTTISHLRIGKSLSTLSLQAIEDARQKFFTPSRILERGGQNKRLYTGSSPSVITAPDEINLNFTSVFCEHQTERTQDEVFWLTYFTYIPDLATLYSEIDNAIKSCKPGTPPMYQKQIQLNVNPKTDIRKTPISSYTTGITQKINFPIGLIHLVEGFGPWHCHVAGYEDDNQEYDAISDVLDQISDYAGYVSEGAEVVAAVSGPTVVTAGAVVVAAAAKNAQVCTEIGSACVKIANYLDEDDFLGSHDVPDLSQAKSDYANLGPGSVIHGPYDLGNYQITAMENRIGQVTISRNWTLKATQGSQTYISKHTWGSPGIKKDINVNFQMDSQTSWISLSGVNHDCVDNKLGDKGHGEWKEGPQLGNNQRTITGKIHVGKSGYGTIKDTAWVQGEEIDTYL
jgi:hypothetical protein